MVLRSDVGLMTDRIIRNYSLLLNLENSESDFCLRSEPETGHVVVGHDDKDWEG